MTTSALCAASTQRRFEVKCLMAEERASPWDYVVAEVVAAFGLFGSGAVTLWLHQNGGMVYSRPFLWFGYLFFLLMAVAAALAVGGFLRGDHEASRYGGKDE